jgi:hypothetical protein
LSAILRRTRVLVGLGAVVALLGITASASANTEHHFFARTVSSSASDSGFSTVDALYVGTHSSHGTRVIGFAHLSCVFTSQDRSLCNGNIELPGGMLLANHVIVVGGEITVVEINGGTGEFAGANGYVRSVNVTDSTSDLAVVLRSGLAG